MSATSFHRRAKSASLDFERWVTSRTLLEILSALGLAIVGFGLFFFVLQTFGEGPTAMYGASDRLSIGECLYFSVVTVSSLGYGDIRPTGLSRAFVAAEVLAGFLFLGLIISRLATAKQDYLLRRIYSSDSQKRLGDFVTDFRRFRLEYHDSLTEIAVLLSIAADEARLAPPVSGIRAAHFQFWNTLHALLRYMTFEVRYGYVFADIPPASLARAATAASEALSEIGSIDSTMSLFAADRLRNRGFRRLLVDARAFGELLTTHSTSERVKRASARLIVIAEEVRRTWGEDDA